MVIGCHIREENRAVDGREFGDRRVMKVIEGLEGQINITSKM